MQVLITGGSGLIGRAITQDLRAAGHQVAWLSRRGGVENGVRRFVWDPDAGTIDPEALQWAQVLIHLAGEGIAEKRWTPKRKQEIICSRTQSTQLLVGSMRERPHQIHTVIAASAIGYYGSTTSIMHEEAPFGTGFLAESVHAWEAATAAFATTGARLVTLRIGIVLSDAGGAYAELTRTAALRTLPVIGNGRQMCSWIHIEDLISIFRFVIENPVNGTLNAVAPEAVDMRTLMHTIARVKKGLYILPLVPACIIRIMMGEMGDMVLVSQHVSADALLRAGYVFRYSGIEAAIRNLEHAE